MEKVHFGKLSVNSPQAATPKADKAGLTEISGPGFAFGQGSWAVQVVVDVIIIVAIGFH